MITSEFEYYLIAELVTMPDRELAQKMELHIWWSSPRPQPKILAKYLNALKASEDMAEFYAAAQKILEESGAEFVPSETDAETQTRTLSPKPPDFVDWMSTPELREDMILYIQLAEKHEPK